MRTRTAVMAGLLGLASVVHLVRPRVFDAIVPPGLGSPRTWTYASGAAEFGCALLLAVPSTRRIGGAASAALMLGVFPANIYTVVKHWDEPRARAISVARLPLQIPLVWLPVSIAAGRG